MKATNLSWRSARNICIVKTLAKLGHYPTRTTEKEAWFLSPLRSETQASFCVSFKKNLWYDHGEGIGGNIIDLIVAIKHCTPYESLQYLDINDSFSSCPEVFSDDNATGGIHLLRTKDITHQGLYLGSRKIPIGIARKYCKEVWHSFKGKTFFSIGLENRLGGWELRNKYYKSSTTPKFYTHLKRPSSVLLVFEGMFDFLSLNVLEENLVNISDCLVLNSLSFVKEIHPLLPSYKNVMLHLDNDSPGRECRTVLPSRKRLYDRRGFRSCAGISPVRPKEERSRNAL